MRTLPTTMIQILSAFAPLFSKRVWRHVQVLLAGAILAPGSRTGASSLRATGLDTERRFSPSLAQARRVPLAPSGEQNRRVGTVILRPSWDPGNRPKSKDYERLTETSEAFIYVAMSRLVVRRVARA